MKYHSLPLGKYLIFKREIPLIYICICFRRFNIGEGKEENAIVTSTGRFIIAWDFAKIKKGKGDSYVIKRFAHLFNLIGNINFLLVLFYLRYDDDVVQDNFRFGDDNEIVSIF